MYPLIPGGWRQVRAQTYRVINPLRPDIKQLYVYYLYYNLTCNDIYLKFD